MGGVIDQFTGRPIETDAVLDQLRSATQEARAQRLSTGSGAKKQYNRCEAAELVAPKVELTRQEKDQFKEWKHLKGIPSSDPRFRAFVSDYANFVRHTGMEPTKNQQTGIGWLYQLYMYMHRRQNKSLGAVVADQVGQGKTLMVCFFLYAILMVPAARFDDPTIAKRILVVVPEDKHISDWVETITKVFNGVDVTFRVTEPNQRRRIDFNIKNIVFVRRSIVEQWGQKQRSPCAEGEFEHLPTDSVLRQICSSEWDCVVVDEAHGIRNGMNFYAALKSITRKSHFRIAMTATSIVNRPKDLLCLFNWVLPGFLRPHIDELNNVNKLKEIIEPIYLYRDVQTKWTTHCFYIELPTEPHQYVEYEKHERWFASLGKNQSHFTLRRRMFIGIVYPGFPFERKYIFTRPTDMSQGMFILKPAKKIRVANADQVGIVGNEGIDQENAQADRQIVDDDLHLVVADDHEDRWIYVTEEDLRSIYISERPTTLYLLAEHLPGIGVKQIGTINAAFVADQVAPRTIELDLDTCVSDSFTFLTLRAFFQSNDELNPDGNIINFMVNRSSKLKALMRIAKKVREYKNEKAIIYTSFIPVVDILFQILGAVYGADSVKQITGRIDQSQRKIHMEEFNNPDHPSTFLISTFAVGSEGFNLENANHVVFMDTPWTYAAIQQAIGRVQRMRQPRDHVYVYSIRTPLDREIKYVRTANVKRHYLDTLNLQEPPRMLSENLGIVEYVHGSRTERRQEQRLLEIFGDDDEGERGTIRVNLMGYDDSVPEFNPEDDNGCKDNSCKWRIVRRAGLIDQIRKRESDPRFEQLRPARPAYVEEVKAAEEGAGVDDEFERAVREMMDQLREELTNPAPAPEPQPQPQPQTQPVLPQVRPREVVIKQEPGVSLRPLTTDMSVIDLTADDDDDDDVAVIESQSKRQRTAVITLNDSDDEAVTSHSSSSPAQRQQQQQQQHAQPPAQTGRQAQSFAAAFSEGFHNAPTADHFFDL